MKKYTNSNVNLTELTMPFKSNILLSGNGIIPLLPTHHASFAQLSPHTLVGKVSSKMRIC